MYIGKARNLSVARCKLYQTQVAHRVYVDGGLESRRPTGNVQRSFGTHTLHRLLNILMQTVVPLLLHLCGLVLLYTYCPKQCILIIHGTISKKRPSMETKCCTQTVVESETESRAALHAIE